MWVCPYVTTLWVYFCCDAQNGFDFASIHPPCSPFTPRITQVPIIAPRKYPAAPLSDVLRHLYTLKGIFLPLLCCFSIFALHFLVPCLTVFNCFLPPPMFSFRYPSACPFSISPLCLSPLRQSQCLLLLLFLCCCHLKPPQLSLVQLFCSGAQCIFKQSIKF